MFAPVIFTGVETALLTASPPLSQSELEEEWQWTSAKLQGPHQLVPSSGRERKGILKLSVLRSLKRYPNSPLASLSVLVGDV